MTIGNSSGVNVGSLNALMGQCAVSWRNAAQQAAVLWSYVVSLGANETAQVAALAAMAGWQNTTTDPQAFWTAANASFAMSQLYYGQINQAVANNYDNGMAQARGLT